MKRVFGALGAAAVAATGVTVVNFAQAPLAMAAEGAGQPGVLQDKTVIFWEGFENRTDQNAPLSLTNYTGGAGQSNQGLNNDGQKYTAEGAWARTDFCNGLVLDSDDPWVTDPALCPNGAPGNATYENFYTNLKKVVGSVGPFTESPSAVGAYTSGTQNTRTTAYGAAMLNATVTPQVTAVVKDRFLTYGVDVANMNCYRADRKHTHPALVFTYQNFDDSGNAESEKLLVDQVVVNNDIATVVDNAVSFEGSSYDGAQDLVLPVGYEFAPDNKHNDGLWISQVFNMTTEPTTGVEGVDWIRKTSTTTNADGSTVEYFTKIASHVINPCSAPASVSTTMPDAGGTNVDVFAGTYLASGSFLTSGNNVKYTLRNLNPSGSGNDGAFDNVRIYDVTPQLDVHYGTWNETDASTHEGVDPADRDTLLYPEKTTITYTITNTDENSSKYGWQFDNVLPTGLKFAGDPKFVCNDVTQTTTNNTAKITISEDNTGISVREGFMPEGGTSCTIEIPVESTESPTDNPTTGVTDANGNVQEAETRANHRTYTTMSASFTNVRGLDMPNPTTVSFYTEATTTEAPTPTAEPSQIVIPLPVPIGTQPPATNTPQQAVQPTAANTSQQPAKSQAARERGVLANTGVSVMGIAITGILIVTAAGLLVIKRRCLND
ncbi:hypothetical protein NQ024_05995 [Corynebacterium sp. 35RC1]|nr:hypothetical protein [Corynebacterium sp. 35RC1]